MDATTFIGLLVILFLITVLIFSAVHAFITEVRWKRSDVLNEIINSVAKNFQQKVKGSDELDSIHLRAAFDKHTPSYVQLNKKVFSHLKETLNQLNLYVEKENGSFSLRRDYPFVHTAIKSTGFFNENDVLAMFSIANSSERNRRVLKEVYHSILEHHSQSIPANSARYNLEFFRLIRTENHQLYKDFKAWIGAVVEADKVNDVEFSRKDKVKIKMKEFIGVYEFKTDYSGENEFLSLPVEWQIDMILDNNSSHEDTLLKGVV